MNLPKRHPGRRHRPEYPDCGPDAGQETDHLAYMNWVTGQVGEHGWAVPGAVGGDGLPPWAYSVGLWLTCQFAELVVCGAPMENMTGIINAIGARVADGEQFGPGDVLTDICPARLELRPVDLSWRMTSLFEVSDEFYGFVRPPYLQVVWADREGRFPWQPRFHPSYQRAQPFLWLPKDDNPPSPWTSINKLTATVKLLVDEPDPSLVAELRDTSDVALASRLAYPEVRSALSAAARDHEIYEDCLDEAEKAWDEYWAAISPVELAEVVKRHAGNLDASRRPAFSMRALWSCGVVALARRTRRRRRYARGLRSGDP